MAERTQPLCEKITGAAKLHSNPASLLAKPENLSATSSGVCLSSVDSTQSDSQTNLLGRSLSDLSSFTPEPSLFGSFYNSHTSRNPESGLSEADNSLTEIELISLTANRPTPRYRLRVDPCTAFLGYNHQDFSGARKATKRLKSILPLSFGGLTTIPSVDNLHDLVLKKSSACPDTSVGFGETDEESELEDEESSLSFSSEQIEGILDYFLLCGLRVSQMAHTYEDLEAITHLLEEEGGGGELGINAKYAFLIELRWRCFRNDKPQVRFFYAKEIQAVRMDSSPASVPFIHSRTRELIRSRTSRLFLSISLARAQKQNDLELAAKIGKNLLDKNHELERRLSEAEKKLTSTEDTISQLQHDLNIRDNLLQIYSRDHQDDDRTSLSSGLISPVPVAGLISDSGDRFSLSSVSCAYLNQKLRELEEENYVLREELAAENEMLVNRLQESQTSQQRLITELGQMRDKYDECLSLFNEARSADISQFSNPPIRFFLHPPPLLLFKSEVRLLRKRSRRAHLRFGYTPSQCATGVYPINSTPCPNDQGQSDGSSSSLDIATGSEIAENSLASDLARTAAKDCAINNVSRLFRAMDQARQVHEQIECGCARPSSSGKYSEYGPEDNVSSSGCFSGSEPSEKPSRGTHSHTPCSRARIVDTSSHDVCSSPLTMAGVNDETLKRHSWFGSPIIHDDCVNPRRAGPHGELTLQNSLDDNLLLSDSPHIPSSDPSTVYAQSYARLPQRLKLIKPLDGSEVLQQWQRLATPSFTRALFDAPLPGVRGRAGVATIADRRAMSVGAGPWSATDRSTSVQRRDLRNGESGHDNLSQDDQHRFGVGLPSHIMCDGIRSRSLEHLQASTRKFRVPAVTGYPAVGRHPVLGDHPIGRLDRISQPETTGLSSPFSLTSLVSALLPFSLSSNNQPVTDSQIDRLTTCEPLPGALKTKNLSCGSAPETEPIRIRPRSPPGSRGLLEVSRIDAETNSVQRVVSATARPNSPSSTISLPGAQPPPASISAQTFIRPSYARTVRNTNLSEITEESGSPPKLSDNTGASQDENDSSPGETSTRCTNGN
ncbi:hypothetical protein D915_006718 [Fasciola hepatica]|uniref:HAP1 N-terminal domain-containing protein n=1 Tax=Fasciola hepatica TaxID=6192 RepID=A0A4E0R349_FASHE|nr:hypothetical protein D915_006718 [Fasciola hepatica]